MKDVLYDAAVKYKDMLNKGYYIVLGRKGMTYMIQLRFTRDSFFHLVGLQHLTDIIYPSKNKERIYKDILTKSLTAEKIKKSVFYETSYLEERIVNLERLEEMLDSCNCLFLINHREYIKYTKIHADYLCQYVLPEDLDSCLYFFCVKESTPKIEHEYKGCSFFRKHNIDYTRGTSETKLLLNKKIFNIGTKHVHEEELFRHSNYKDEKLI